MTSDRFPEENVVVFCEGAFQTTSGKIAHGLIRFTQRYHVTCVIDSSCSGRDSGDVLDGRPNGIPIVADVADAIAVSREQGFPATHFVVGIAPDGGRITHEIRAAVTKAMRFSLNVDCGLHDLLTEDAALACIAAMKRVKLRDIRKPPPRADLHRFSGKINDVTSLRIALLGTDSAVGKGTTAWKLVHAFQAMGRSAEMIGTGQTAWMQGARHGVILDSLVNDFVAGEIEHAVWSAWDEQRPDVIVVEGQGSLMNPVYPRGAEILAATRPDVVVLQHAPGRTEYDGYPGFPLHPLDAQIQSIELISGRPVVAVTINHDGISADETHAVCSDIQTRTGRPTFDVLPQGAGELATVVWNAARPKDTRHSTSMQATSC